LIVNDSAMSRLGEKLSETDQIRWLAVICR